MKNNLIEQRDERTKKRKAKKRKMDSVISLSAPNECKGVKTLAARLDDSLTARLLDEGYIDIDGGFVIKKGALEKYLSGKNEYVAGWTYDGEAWGRTGVLNLTSDFVGTVNLGHMDFPTMPYILGEWTRNDLSLEDIGDGRHGLNINVNLDEDSIFVKELRRQSHDIGLSAEFYVHENLEDTKALSDAMGYYIPVFDEIFIYAYGLVGECGNVNSSGLRLKGETMKDIKKEEFELENDSIETDEDIVEEGEDITEEEVNTSDEAEGETADESEDVTEEEGVEEEADEVGDNEVDADVSGDDVDEEAIVLALKNQIESLNERIAGLEEANAKLKKNNRRLSAKYKTEMEKKEQFKEDLKNLAIELLPEEDAEEKVVATNTAYFRGDGIGEIK